MNALIEDEQRIGIFFKYYVLVYKFSRLDIITLKACCQEGFFFKIQFMPSSGASRAEESDADKLHGRGGQNISQELPSSLTGYFSIVPSEKDQKRINIWIKTLRAGDQADVLIVPGQTSLDPPSLRPRRQEPLTSPNT